MIKELEHTRITKTEIHLRNLGEKSVYDLVESTLNIDPKKARGMMPRTLEEMKLDNDERVEKCTSLKTLTHEVCNITNGNPFFIKQQIIYWIGQGLLALDENDQWVWDIDKIRESNVLGDVVSMILEKIKMLPVSTQRALTVSIILFLIIAIGLQYKHSTTFLCTGRYVHASGQKSISIF